MVFNILIDNTDDHEQNHALLVSETQQYELSPAFDILPSGQALGFQQMRVGEDEADSTLANARSMANLFALDEDAAIKEVGNVAAVVKQWQEHFRGCGVTPATLICTPNRSIGLSCVTNVRNFWLDGSWRDQGSGRNSRASVVLPAWRGSVYAFAQLLSVSVQCFYLVFHKFLILNAYQDGTKLAPRDLAPLIFIGTAAKAESAKPVLALRYE